MERVKRTLAITSSELANCMDQLPAPMSVDVQFVVDGFASFLLAWGLLRLAWDATHRRPDLFPLDR